MESDNFASLTDDRQVYEMWGSWSQHVETWTQQKADQVLVVRYEDMLDDPISTFTTMAQHLRQAPGRADVRLAIERSSFDRLNRQEQAVGFAEKTPRGSAFFRVGRSGQWRDQLEAEQIRRIVARHHRQMQRFGYLTDELRAYVPAQVSA
jgi:hypothetical protein